MSNQSIATSLIEAAVQLEEDAAECWGVRRKLNLKSAAKRMRTAAAALEKCAL